MKKKAVFWILTFLFLTGCGKATDMQKQSLENEKILGEDIDEKFLEEDTDEKLSKEEISEEEQQKEEQPDTQESETQHSGGTKADFEFQDVADRAFSFSSGAGAWSTELYINSDGTFHGLYSDSDMGDTGENYPNGTRYYSHFTGRFTELEKIDEFTYKMKLESLELEQEPNKEEISDGFRYISSGAYGLEGGEDFYLYLPGAELASLPENYLHWVNNYLQGISNDEQEDTTETKLPFYGLYNVKEEQGFSSYEYEEESLSERIAVEISFAKERVADLEVKLQEISSQSEMNAISEEIYQTWDDALNTVWKLLEAELDDATMEALRIEEREWIKFKEAEVEAVGEEFGAGTIRPAEEFAKAAELTEKRVYELAEYAE